MNKNVIRRLLLCLLLLCVNFLCGCSEKVNLTDEQIESLCEQLAEVDDSYADLVPTKAAAAIHVYGVEREGDIGYVYCYTSDGTYVKVNNKAYMISGGNGPEILTIQFEGDKVILLDIEASVSTLDTMEKYPLKYRFIDWFYNAYTNDGYCKLQLEEAEKIEKAWNVEVELEYCIDIFENGIYEVWKWVEDGPVTIEKGKIEK